MELIYTKGDLFKVAPPEAYLLHACNCKGVWGSGIAKQFKDHFPEDFINYNEYSRSLAWPGDSLITSPSNIVCLYTSYAYGSTVSDPDTILNNTTKALKKLKQQLPYKALIYSPKINAGLFATPWEDTEKLINEFLAERPDVTWVVVDYVS